MEDPASTTFVDMKSEVEKKVKQFFICLPQEFLPVLGSLTRQCASTLGAALLCSSRAGSDLGLVKIVNIFQLNFLFPGSVYQTSPVFKWWNNYSDEIFK